MSPLPEFVILIDIIIIGIFIIVCDFLVVRTLKYGLPFWNRTRRKYVMWDLMHSHLSVISAAMLMLVLVLVFIISEINEKSFWQDILGSAPVLLVIIAVLVVIFSLTILPPFAIIFYFVVRRLTRRLDNLVKATGALRDGDYGSRVKVEGGDEVAQLQSDFNTMAVALEKSRHDLATERDRVAALLKSRRELFAAVSHELRTPVATLLAHIEVTVTRPNSSPDVMQESLTVMERETLRLQHLIDDLFTVAHAETGNIEFDIRALELPPLLEHMTTSIQPLAWQKSKIQVLLDLPTVLPAIQADSVRLEQIISNLLHNAIRHTPPGGLIVVSAENEETGVKISVTDTGSGISPENLLQIWERFYQGDNNSVRNNQGAGLGLALVKELTQAMGGRVAVESEVGEGSCFTIWLPCA